MMRFIFLFLLSVFCFAPLADAQEPRDITAQPRLMTQPSATVNAAPAAPLAPLPTPTPGLNPARKDPLEITADGFFEWKRAEKKFIAQKNAVAKQGDVSISAATLSAEYDDGGKSSMEIRHLLARENVVIRSGANSAYGAQADYDIVKGYAEMTGGDLKLVSPDQTLTAQERFEYWVTDGRLLAVGGARVVRPKVGGGSDTLEADTIIATLKEDSQGKRVLDTLEAKGNVKITTPTEVATGAYAIYRAATNKAELQGGVKIARGPNILEGNRAEVDMNTNTSRIFGSTTSNNGQVRGVFYPGSE